MSATRHRSKASKGAAGRCRDRRRSVRQRWVRPFFYANLAMDASQRLIDSAAHVVAATERTLQRRPVQASQKLQDASELLRHASRRLRLAAKRIAKLTACIEREPEATRRQQVPELLVFTTKNYEMMASWLAAAVNEVSGLHNSVRNGLKTGTLVPERPADRRPRIVLAPRPVPVRAFLRLRQPRVRDRIAPLLLRRRRTPRPAALTVPQPSLLGRAPPLSLILR